MAATAIDVGQTEAAARGIALHKMRRGTAVDVHPHASFNNWSCAMFRKTLLILALAVLVARPAATVAAEPVPFTAEAFADAQAARQLIVVHVNAFWCPTCGAQRPILADILDEVATSPELGDLAIFTVDFDTQDAVVRKFNVSMQGTLIVFTGKIEVGRLIGETDSVAIKALLLKAKTTTPEQVQAALVRERVLTLGSYVLAVLAGMLSVLSPCVLPLLPLVVGAAAAAHRFGAVALSGGVALSYTVIGLFVATLGLSIGLAADAFRMTAAVLLLLAGVVLLSEPLQERLALAGGRLGDTAERLMARITPSAAGGQFLIGVLLGAIWSPCVGPTLAAAATLAAQRETLGQVTMVMLLFGLGAAVPLALVGAVSRHALISWRGRMGAAGRAGKLVLGVLFVLIGGAILSGFDRVMETFLLQNSPQWLTAITIHF
jgi:cytochrome c biogenesis protein CcdA